MPTSTKVPMLMMAIISGLWKSVRCLFSLLYRFLFGRSKFQGIFILDFVEAVYRTERDVFLCTNNLYFKKM